jgi:uncharacterized protein YbjT (DUF2867 family)
MSTRAIVIGSTGLVGKQLVGQLLADARFERVVSFVRRPSGRTHARLEEHVIDFRAPDAWADRVEGDVLFSTLGTTLKQAGSKEAQYEVDYTFQFNTAQAAAKNGVKEYVLVSADRASPSSMVPSQSLSRPSLVSGTAGLRVADVSSQSPETRTYPAGAAQAVTVSAASP